MATTLYEQLEKRCLPLIEHYHADLTTHDRGWIERNAGTPFLHFTGVCGTHIVPFEAADKYPARGERVPYLFGTADRGHILAGVRTMAEYLGGPGADVGLVLYYDGAKLREIDGRRAVELAREYVASVWAEWERPTFRAAGAMDMAGLN